MADIRNMRIAMLATNGVEQVELTGPAATLREAGATVTVVSQKGGEIQGMNQDEKGDRIKVDVTLDSVTPGSFDALVLPGGVANPDYLRVDPGAIAFVKHFADAGKPIAAICHGPWTLIDADAVRGRTVTSWPSLRTDLSNAGAEWVDREVVVSGNLVTSRKPDDIPAFTREFMAVLGEAVQRPAD